MRHAAPFADAVRGGLDLFAKVALIQPRTSPPKIFKKYLKYQTFAILAILLLLLMLGTRRAGRAGAVVVLAGAGRGVRGVCYNNNYIFFRDLK